MATSVTPPSLQGPTAKEKKYDRQLRLWAASGQQALEEAQVLLLNSGSGVVGVETLKNLVLPGVGNFTIVDDKTVDEADLGVNFFLEEESLGKSRAEESCRLLRELNPEVNGSAIQKPVQDFISEADLSKYTLIILIGPTHIARILDKVSKYAHERSIPLFYVKSIGFYSHVSLQLPALFPIVDTHPDPVSTQDLRLLKPWEELLEHMKLKTKDLESMSDHDHGHVPYLLLLLYYLGQWKDGHNGKYPEAYKDKVAFRETVKAAARTGNAEGGEENFDEAVAAVLKSLNAPTVPSGLKAILAEPECKDPKSTSSNFWLIANAINTFVEENGVLPLPGALPDMKSQSSDYIDLQNIYRAKAQKDLASVTSTVRQLEQKLRKSPTIPSQEIEAFCKGAAFIKLIRGRKLRIPDQHGRIDWDGHERIVERELGGGEEESLLPVYLVLSAVDSALNNFQHTSNSLVLQDPCYQLEILDVAAEVPSTLEDDLRQNTLQQIQQILTNTSNKIELLLDNKEGQGGGGTLDSRLGAIIKEVVRTGPVELHNISSMTGGIAAQEIIKVITKQYVPIDNTCVLDGIRSKTGMFRL